MALASTKNIRSKLERAVRAYLISAGVGGPDEIVIRNTTEIKANPLTSVYATSTIEEPPLSGNRQISMQIVFSGSAVMDGREEDPEAVRVKFDDQVSRAIDALTQTDNQADYSATAQLITQAGRALAVAVDNTDNAKLLADNNADMVDFTCIMIYPTGDTDGDPESDQCLFKEVHNFTVMCAPSNVD